MRVLGRSILAFATAATVLAGTVTAQAPASAAPATATPRILGGKVTSTPSWFAHVITRWKNGDWGVCGGSLIGPTWVLTANHCVSPAHKLVQSKSYVQVAPPNEEDGERIPIARVIRHPGFSFRTFRNDIALIELAKEMPNTTLPYAGPNETIKYGDQGDVYGFGATNRAASNSSYRLRRVTVTDLQVGDKCGRYPSSEFIASQMECWGVPNGSKDSCAGDSGGALIRAGDRVEVGIVSWGEGCGIKGYPGVYTRVMTYANWIKDSSGVPWHGFPN